MKFSGLLYQYCFAIMIMMILSIIGSEPVFSQQNKLNTNNTGLAKQAEYYFNKADYKNALNRYLRLEKTTKGNDNSNYNLALVRIGSIYHNLEKEELSLTYLKKAIKSTQLSNDSVNLAYTFNGLGNYYRSKKIIDSSIIFYNQALEIFYRMSDFKGIAGINNNLANFKFSEGKCSQAISYYYKSYSIAKEHNFLQDQALYLLNIGAAYKKLNKKDSAIYYLKKIIENSNKGYATLNVSRGYNELYEIYKNNNQFREALYYKELHHVLSDSIFNRTLNEEIAKITTASEIQAKENKLKLLKKQDELNAAQISKQYYLILLLALLLLLLITLLYQLNKWKKFQADKFQAEITEEKLKTKLRLLENELLKEKNDTKSREILTMEILNNNKNDIFVTIQKLVDKYKSEKNDKILQEIYQQIKNNTRIENDWESFKLHFEEVHPNFFISLHEKFPDLTLNNLKLCAYLKIGLTNKEIAVLLNIDPDSVKRSKIRLKKKLNIELGREFNL